MVKPLKINGLISEIPPFSEEVVAEIEKQNETIKKLTEGEILIKCEIKDLRDELYNLKITSNIYFALTALILLISNLQ